MLSSTTATYLHVDDIDVKVDFYVPSGVEGNLPAVVYFHGGGLVTGSRKDMLFPEWAEQILGRKIIFLSADYRLLVPATGFAPIEDAKALFAFLADATKVQPYLPAGVHLDSSRISVCGTSAGGYMVRLCGIHAVPSPVAAWSLYGMGGDFLLDFWVQAHAETFPSPLFGEAPQWEDVKHLLEGMPSVEADVPVSFADGKLADKSNRLKFFPWLYMTGELLDKLTGVAKLGEILRTLPYEDRAAAIPKDVLAVFPQFQLTKDFPPTLLTHGAADVVVLAEESERTHRQLQALGVQSQLTIVPGVDHGLNVPGTFPPQRGPGRQEAIDAGIEFMAKYLAAR